MSAQRWLAGGDWATADHHGTLVADGRLALAEPLRHGVAVLRAGRPHPAQVDAPTADRWRRVVLRLAEPVPESSWLRLWTRVEAGGGAPGVPDLDGDAWRAAPVGATDVRVLDHAEGDLWVAVELGGLGATTPLVADLLVATGDDGPVTELPVAYREADDGDGVLGRFLGLLGAQVERTASLIDELPALLSPAVAPDRDDAPWLERLATWVALDVDRLPAPDAERRETVATAVARHGRRGTRDGLVDQVRRETGLEVEVTEPLLDVAVWRLDGSPLTSRLGLSTGLVAADPGPPALDRTALLDGSMLISPEEAGLPVHGRAAHRICVHVPDATPELVAAVDAVVQRERPAHVLATTVARAPGTRVPTEVGADPIPRCSRPGLRDDTAYRIHEGDDR